MKYHMSVTPGYMIGNILKDGVKKVLINYDGTNDEAIAQIRAATHITAYTIGECDNKKDNGRCAGHSS